MYVTLGTLVGIIVGVCIALLGYIFINAGRICDEKINAVYSPDNAPARFVYTVNGKVYKTFQANIPPTKEKIELVKGNTYEVYVCSWFPSIIITSKEVPSSQFAMGIVCIMVGCAIAIAAILVSHF